MTKCKNMQDIQMLIDTLEKGPLFLENLLASIPPTLHKIRRKKGKWSIHEHTCHLPVAEQMIQDRYRRFLQEDRPHFTSYIPGETVEDHLMEENLQEALEALVKMRTETIDLLRSFPQANWIKKADHEEYTDYGAYILLRHHVMHDHFHMYRIEELWITRDQFL